MLAWLLRILFVAFATTFAVQTYDAVKAPNSDWDQNIALLYAGVAAGVAVLMVFFEARFQKRLVRDLVAAAFGLVAGIVVTAFIVLLLVVLVLPSQETLGDAFLSIQFLLPLVITAVCYLSVTIVLQTKGDFRFLLPYIDFSHRGARESGFFLDTSAIIDGRIVDLIRTNLIATPIIIPDFVVQELQRIADSADRLKRNRGRRGLDMVKTLRETDAVWTQIMETNTPNSTDVDLELVILARDNNGRIVTADFNLNKVAQIEGVRVVNINEVAGSLRPVYLPGEKIILKIQRAGEEAGQGVGYLPDGTMVVVDAAREFVGGADIEATVTGSLQTAAGRMVFARFGEKDESDTGKFRSAKRRGEQ